MKADEVHQLPRVGVAGQVQIAAPFYIAPEHTFKNTLIRGAEVQPQLPTRHLYRCIDRQQVKMVDNQVGCKINKR
jgi:hypothetical protein